MENNKYDYLVPEISKNLTDNFLKTLTSYPLFKQTVDTSPLLNMTVGVFVGSLIHILDKIKETTIGEAKLIQNIELTKETLINAISDLPFVSKVEFV